MVNQTLVLVSEPRGPGVRLGGYETRRQSEVLETSRVFGPPRARPGTLPPQLLGTLPVRTLATGYGKRIESLRVHHPQETRSDEGRLYPPLGG